MFKVRFPFISELRHYSWNKFRFDLIAGATLDAFAVQTGVFCENNLKKNRTQSVPDLSHRSMKSTKVVVLWKSGLHLRPAAKLVQVAKQFQSKISLRCGNKVADIRSIFSVIALCATMGTGVDIEAVGDDEQDAIQAIERVFSSQLSNNSPDQARTRPL